MSSNCNTDWALCVLCQTITDEKLTDPLKVKKQTIYTCGYTTISANITEFSKLGCIPLNIDIERLNDGKGIEQTLMSNQAKWHNTCYRKFNLQKLNRIKQKRKSVP